MRLQFRSRSVHFPRPPMLMGILNINDDSFCGDGTLDQALAAQRAQEMVDQGAEIIDVGAESARTNREAISVQEEVDRLSPFLAWFATWRQHFPPATAPLISVNTWRPEVIRQVLPYGVDLLNDISALPDATNAALCATHGTALLIMHSVGLPKQAHKHVEHADIMATLLHFFQDKLKLATQAGCSPQALILDPGIDFAKQRDDNLSIYRNLEQLHALQKPILLPISRKSVIKHTLGIQDPTARDAATLASLVAGHQRGAHLFRVHNVPAAKAALATLEAVAPSGKRQATTAKN